MEDLFNNVNPKVSLAPLAAAVADNTPQVGVVIDRKGYSSLTYLIITGVLADAGATFTVLLEHGDDAALADAAAVPDNMLLGTEALASFTETADGKCFKLGYIGDKRYSRLTITPAGNGSAAPMAVIAELGDPEVAPTANPPA